MFTDIVGYTSLMGEHEEKALDILRKNRNVQKSILQKYSGILLKEMGDGNLSRFDSALNAVLCAIEIQKYIRRNAQYKLRIGIHLGDISVENEDIFGDGVNITSRLESISDPGAIYVSDAIIKAIRGIEKIRYAEIGPIEFKNVSEPVVVYYILEKGLAKPNRQKIKELTHTGSEDYHTRWASLLHYIKALFVKPRDAPIQSLAVLPFSNLMEDQEQDYFVAGMHDAMITELSKIGSFRVISRQSTLKYTGSTLSIKDIAKQLDVDAIVEGSVLKSDDQVRIQVQLIKALPYESHIFANAYDRKISDIINMHKTIAYDIVNNIESPEAAIEKEVKQAHKKVNADAYEAYLKGSFHWNELTKEALDVAEDYFQLAIKKDPEYALAYVGMSSIGVGRAQMGYTSWKDSALIIQTNLDKARHLDPTLAEIHFINAVFNFNSLWKWEKAETEYREALKFNPNYAIAHAYYSHFLCLLKRPEEGLEYIATAMQLDPFNTLYKEIHGMDLFFARDYDQARKILEEILVKTPESRLALSTLRSVFHQQKEYLKALDTWKKIYVSDHEALMVLENGFQTGGYTTALKSLAEMFEIRSKKSFVSPWRIATIYTRSGNKDEAIEWLHKAYLANDPNIPSINVDPIFDYLREESEFINLMERLDFPA
jgi:TolB-like protein/Tfp pilus assembly protein PilF